MFKKVIVPTDGSDHAKRAVQAAAELAAKFGSELTVLHVMPRVGRHRIPPELEHYAKVEHLQVNEAELLQHAAQTIVERAKQEAQSQRAANVLTAIDSGDAAAKIIEHIDKREIDTVVMGRRGLGDLAGLFLGSVSHNVSQGTSVACITVGANG